MISTFLTVLKIIGIMILSLLLLLFAVLLLILFVPVRYRVSGFRKEGDEAPVNAALKATWLLHIVSLSFCYPGEAYVKVRLFGFTVFSADRERSGKKKKEEKKKKEKPLPCETDNREEKTPEKKEKAPQKKETTETAAAEENPDADNIEEELQKRAEAFEEEEAPTMPKFLSKLLSVLKNIKYTIRQIYDKIRHMMKNVRYYIRILESDTFKRAWSLCSREAFSLVKSILPGKLTADFVIGTGDPASTAQILAIEGILYPFVGGHIKLTPDFEHSVVEGNFLIKGKITVWRILLTAVRVYFNRDLRRVIRLFKKEAA